MDAFYCVPEPTAPGYAEALLDVVRRERVDVFVPVSSPAASLYDARARKLLDDVCDVLHVDAETAQLLDDKANFSGAAAALGLRVPDYHRITDAQEVVDFDFAPGRSYILKRIAYNPVGRMDLTPLTRETSERNAEFVRSLTISPADPWILQEFITGQEYCTHGTVRGGWLQVYGCCESSAFQINYAQVDKPEIRAWGRGIRRGIRPHRSSFLRLHRGRRRARIRHRVQSADPLGDHDVLRPPAGGGGLPRERAPRHHPSAAGAPDLLDLSRALATADAAGPTPEQAGDHYGGQGRDLYPGGIHCRT